MKLFTVKLTDDERAKLEAHRARLGLRSQADVIRRWIATAAAEADTMARVDLLIAESTAPDGRLYLAPHSESPTLPVGPVPTKPGDRLKKPKR